MFCPMQKLQAARGAHCCANWILMRRCDKDSPSLPIPFDACGDIQTFIVHWNRHREAAGQSQNVSSQPVARFLHPGRIPGVEQDTRRNLERLLGTGNDHDLFKIAVYGSCDSKVVTNSFAQGSQSHGPAIMKIARSGISAMSHDQPRPDLEGELIVSRLADAKGPEPP